MKKKNTKILVTGGCGYVGTVLVKNLLQFGYEVTVIDTQWFGNYFKGKIKNLKVQRLNINNIDNINLSGYYAIIHLANIANDPSALIDARLTWDVNVLFTKKVIEHAIHCKVKKFIYASSGSVYGVKKEKKVTEDLSLLPISDYNKSKMIAEQILMSYKKNIKVYCIRPATVCGFSENMRLDISVNLLTFQAITKKQITVFGGNQIRPNIHIKDLCGVFKFFLEKNLPSGAYNAGFENLKILDLAKKISKITPTKIKIIKNTNDPRSYRQDSSKLIKYGFKKKYNVENAIKELVQKFSELKFKNNKHFFRVSYMKANLKKIIN